jgi:c-di-GMP-binding flagellar brake protein YcgR
VDHEQPEEVVLTHTENISIGGAAVIVKKTMELFAVVHVEIDLMDSAELITCQARVVWVVRRKAIEEHKPSFYDIGLEFVDIKDEQRERVSRTVEHLVHTGREAKYR